MRAALAPCALALAACAVDPFAGNRFASANADDVDSLAPASPDAPVSSDVPPANPSPPASSSDCPVLRSSGWQAHVDTMPEPGARPSLIISGRVTVPTGGYRVALRMGQIAESYPVQVTVYLDATPPTGMATQALVTHGVRDSWPSEARVGSDTVRCGSTVLARIDNIATAH